MSRVISPERSADTFGNDLDPVLQRAGARQRHTHELLARTGARADVIEK